MTWLNYVPYLMEQFADARFICLRRDKDATVKSWVSNLGDLGRLEVFVLYHHHQKLVSASTFPDYEDLPILEAISKFYDAYYAKAEEYLALWPRRFRIYTSPHVLNDRTAQAHMKRFAGRSKLPFRALKLNQLETLAEGEEKDLKKISRHTHRRLYRAAARYLMKGGDPSRQPTIRQLARHDDGLMDLVREVLSRDNPEANMELLTADDLSVKFTDLPIGSAYDPEA